MPSDNIKRAIQKEAGGMDGNYEEWFMKVMDLQGLL
jgi:transcriptional/translational regulatory protein YebC/TACO1